MMKEIAAKEARYMAQTYARQPVAIVSGKGAVVKDVRGKQYVDCFAGIAVLNVGHSHPEVLKAIAAQSRKLMHVSNLYYTLPQIELAELLYKISGGYKSFFCNSGAEANEAAIKLVRKCTGKSEIIAAHNSFHGRTFAALSATGQEKYKQGFGELVKGFKHVEFGSIDALRKEISENTAAVMLEPIQGEGGVVVPPEDYLKQVRELCDEKGALLVLDEVQTAFGRCGAMFAWQLFGAEPDIFTLAKALGGGFPIGAMRAKEEVMQAFQRGDHASTFGGSPLACAAAKAAVEVVIKEKLAQKAQKLGEYFKSRLNELKKKHAIVKDVRGRGLMLGMELEVECKQVVAQALERGVLLNCTHERVLRFVPPLVITKKQIDVVLRVLDEVLGSIG